MSGLGLAGGFGAGAAGASLGDILKQKFLEQIQRAKLAEDMRQADMTNQIQRGNLDLGQQRIGVERDTLGQHQRQFDVTSGQTERRLGMDEQLQPLKIKQMGAQTANTEAQTGETLRKPQAEVEARDYQTGRDTTQHGYRMGEIGAQGANALRVARERPPAMILAPTTDAQGNPTQTVVPKTAGTVIGVKPTAETSQTRQMGESARDVLPRIPHIQQEAEALNKLGLFGPGGGRFRDLMAKKIGAGELAGGNAENARLIGKFTTDLGLFQTALARTHGGARAAGNVTLMKHIEDITNGKSADLPMFLGQLDAVGEWLQGYAAHGGPQGGAAPPAPVGDGKESVDQRIQRLTKTAKGS